MLKDQAQDQAERDAVEEAAEAGEGRRHRPNELPAFQTFDEHIPTQSRQRSFIKPKWRYQVDSFGKSVNISPVGISSTDLILVTILSKDMHIRGDRTAAV